MPVYQVEYTADKRPTDLPVGAEVKQVSALPATVKAIHSLNGSKTVRIGAGVCDRKGATLEVRDIFDSGYAEICLSGENVDTLIEALTEARGTDKTSTPVKRADIKPYESTRSKDGGTRFHIHAAPSAIDTDGLYLQIDNTKGSKYESFSEWLTPKDTAGLYRVLKEIHGDA